MPQLEDSMHGNAGRPSWNKGKPMSAQHKANLSKSKLGKKIKGGKHKVSAWNKGLISPNKGKTYEEIHGEKAKILREQKSKITKEWWETADELALQKRWEGSSASGLKRVLAGTFNPHENRFKAITTTVQTTKGGKVKCQGSWERIYIESLEVRNDVVEFRKDKIRLPYVLDNENRVYIVDFLVMFSSGKKELVEVKPLNLTETEENKAKFAAARKWCEENNATFVIVTEKEIEIINGGKLP